MFKTIYLVISTFNKPNKMKIQLKLSEKQLSALVYALDKIPRQTPKQRHEKVAKCVLDKVCLKFKKKQLDVQHEVNLFSTKKKFSFVIEIVEAHFLEEYLSIMLSYPLSDYDRNVLRLINNNLNQQLA